MFSNGQHQVNLGVNNTATWPTSYEVQLSVKMIIKGKGL